MPSSIPYDPSLVLGNIVTKKKLENIVQISKLQAPADAAEYEMNALNSLKRSIDMTVEEMIDMKVDPGDLVKESQDVGKQLQEAAVKYGKAKIQAEKAILPLRSKINMVNEQIESPIDYNKSSLKTLPLAVDSIQMNCQYFSFDQNSQSSHSHASTVASFIGGSVSYLGDKASSEAKSTAQAQMNSQHSKHSIAGTLVISINCTHKKAQVYAPYRLDVDKAVKTWNQLFPDDLLKTNSPASIGRASAQMGTKDEKAFYLLSGASYGSSFVAMVHVLNTTESSSSQSMYSVAESLQASFEVGCWFAEASGKFGVNESFSNSAKNLLSTQNISSHCSLIVMGVIPSIKSNEVKMTVQQFADFSPDKAMASLAAIQNANADDMATIGSAAGNAKAGQQMESMQTSKIQAALSGVAEIDDGANKIIDINSVMNAMEDYIEKCISSDDSTIGVPLNYYLKPITKAEIARSWMNKYYPNRYNAAGSADDSTPKGGAASSDSSDADSSSDE
ncbi:hypothetical protein VA7868_00365 [Vibrio aerogenes CECT 7868]|uniref:Uncharacterized protein n=1 Tax=Vibrio aerogenes CECT 7868 TaxID=1216006 RepID=A0A1M5VF17_9VIBR|nr:hypothetical protein [Vibrio aerogenes]SHH73704.1 hypothetical protein VA7868_00365 [Vibrio aerogenes CECT 7868]